MNLQELNQIVNKIIKTKPDSVKKIPAGLTNDDYLVKTTKGAYVFRIPKKLNAKLFNYRHEALVLKAVRTTGYDVPFVYFDATSGIKVSTYLPGLKSFKNSILSLKTKIELVAKGLKEIHQLKVKQSIEFNPFNKLEKYRSLVNKALFKDEAEVIALCLKQYQTTKLVLCHNDLVDGNLLFKDKELYIIDYEYAGYNHPLFDLASFLSENNIEDVRYIKQLLRTYFNTKKIDAKYKQLMQWYRFNDLLWSYWAKMMDKQDPKPIFKKIYQLKAKRYLKQK